jgi:hypothetical protein
MARNVSSVLARSFLRLRQQDRMSDMLVQHLVELLILGG